MKWPDLVDMLTKFPLPSPYISHSFEHQQFVIILIYKMYFCLYQEMKQLPSAACDNFNGYCDVFLKCRKVDADGPLNRLRKKFFSKEAIMGYIAWIKKYWWACVLIGVGLIILMACK